MQVNKKTAPELLKAWRTNSKANPVDVYIHDKRVVHMRNWLCKVCAKAAMGGPCTSRLHARSTDRRIRGTASGCLCAEGTSKQGA